MSEDVRMKEMLSLGDYEINDGLVGITEDVAQAITGGCTFYTMYPYSPFFW